MNVLIYIPTGLNTPEFEILLSKTQQEIDSGNKVTILLCKGGKNYSCSKNIYSISLICFLCKKKTNIGLEKIKGTYDLLYTPTINSIQIFKFKNKLDLLKKKYRFVNVGIGAFSSYTNITRDKDLEAKKSQSIINNLVNTSIKITDYLYIIKKKYKFSKFILFNGRMNQYRPFFDIFRRKNLNNYEFKGFKNRVYNFKNFFSQDLVNLKKLILKQWSKNRIQKKDIKIIHQHFANKIKGEVSLDLKSYTNYQKKNILPNKWDLNIKNIVYFTSSDDEFESYGREHWLKKYKDHTDAVCRVAKSLSNFSHINLWIRMHPSLRNVKWGYVQKIKALEHLYSNVNVISPDSKVSSYALLKSADIVIGTSSTHTLLEATYWGKASVCVGPSLWSKLRSSYYTREHDQLIKLLLKTKLKPKNKLAVFKFIYFWTAGGVKQRYLSGNLNQGFYFKNNKLELNLFFKILYVLTKFQEKLYAIFKL